MTTTKPDLLLWIDLETTGLNPNARILETGLRATTMDATHETARLTRTHHINSQELIQMELPAIRIHLDNNLLADCETTATNDHDNAHAITGFILALADMYTLHPAGTNPQFDVDRLLAWLDGVTPDASVAVANALHYRRLDLTGLRFALQARGHHPYKTGHQGTHRVDDCLDGDIQDYKRFLSLIPSARRPDQVGTDNETEA